MMLSWSRVVEVSVGVMLYEIYVGKLYLLEIIRLQTDEMMCVRENESRMI